ncbi:MAG TPA: TIGR03960 family B12-binding radical SAM protein [Candidatus Hydrogenedentes bacterium]|nr:TIGR03960 family B12-binding radical SAM protein [Candidatus Hydrogenedentota bacterium]HPO85750.1 TIGR03960 family B12-binding radical SAM protein [Candidatus Hydrogenedentota bacterium]
MSLLEILEREVFPRVEKASRYLGTEYNAIHKDPRSVDLRVALVFPDLYDMGLGNLGLLVLYAILNRLSWCWCERAYAPAPDMERLLRERRLPLFAHESKDPLGSLDLIGFTLQSELTYTTVLNCIDLAGLPLRSSARRDDDPLIAAGGPGAFNPEPLAPFIDFFVIGDGEDVILEIAECLRATKNAPRGVRLEQLAKIEGVYVPALYPVVTLPDGRTVPDPAAPKVRKRLVRNLNEAYFPTRLVVPFTQQIHDRAGMEIMRGCTHGCRFCQAGMISRPVRERELEKIESLFEKLVSQTGYEEVSLVSLSTCDYSRARALVFQSAQQAKARRTSVSLPSLRLDTFSIELAELTADVRRTGLTVAPEAATPRLRAVINKWLPDEDLLEMCAEAFRRGWTHIKAYFMIGLPGERDEDIEAIVDLCVRALETGRKANPQARIHIGVSTFVPKPFTPFQWAEQISLEETRRRQDILRKRLLKYRAIKFGYHAPQSTFIEGLISRSDRSVASVLEEAWKRGARLDSWDEYLNFQAWQDAIATTGFSVDYAYRQRQLDETLPWDFIDPLISKAWLKAEWCRAQEEEHRPDCRRVGCHSCGVSAPDRPLCNEILKRAMEGAAEITPQTSACPTTENAPPPIQRLRFRVGRKGLARFLSHLELTSAWIRSLRRADAPLAYSQGFHAHPKVSFASAPPVGEESEGDYMDVILTAHISPEKLRRRLTSVLPEGLFILDVCEVPLNAPSLNSQVAGFVYDIFVDIDERLLKERIESLMKQEEIQIERKSKEGGKSSFINVKPMITHLHVQREDNKTVCIHLETRIIDQRSLRIRDLCVLLEIDPASVRIVKRNTRFSS